MSPNDTFNIEYEKFVLGAMWLKNGEIIPKIEAILDADDFYRPEHRIIFKDTLKIYNELKKPVNFGTVIDFLKSNGDIDKVGGLSYIFALVETANTTAYAEFYADEIKQKSDLRKLKNVAEKIISAANSGVTEPLDIISKASNDFNLLSGKNNDDFALVGTDLYTKFLKHIETRQDFSSRKTGFDNIDKYQLFEPGLYILGATPACGKTTFAWQLLEQISNCDVKCIFCSYEMSKFELEAKTIARKLFQHYQPKTTLTAADILRGGWTNDIVTIIENEFKNENFLVREFTNETVDKLLAILRPVVKSCDTPPVVCIDYLQRLIPRDGKSIDTRAIIDDALFKLKDFSKETNTTFIVISTFNRVNYNQTVDFEAFKESGGIEYTADVVWALQLDISNKLSGEKQEVIRQKINAAKKEQPRKINLKCLKNRKGNIYDCFFKYFSAHDYFKPCDAKDFTITEPKPTAADDDEEGEG